MAADTGKRLATRENGSTRSRSRDRPPDDEADTEDAEGYKRGTVNDTNRFLRIARGSLAEARNSR
jgi:hypothetical protein